MVPTAILTAADFQPVIAEQQPDFGGPGLGARQVGEKSPEAGSVLVSRRQKCYPQLK
jgi:hypothetical protein